MKRSLVAAVSFMPIFAFSFPSLAQDQANGQEDSQGASTSSQCIQDLRELSQTMREEGFWLTGYRGYGTTGVAPTTSGTSPTTADPQPVPPEDPAGEFAMTPEGGDTTQDVDTGPWGNVDWEQRPQYEIGVLYEAAYILANNGDQENCQNLVQAARDRYQGYVAELEELGIDPQEVTDWRQAEIAASEPVTELEGRFRTDDIIGANVRSAEDENLGSIDDVILDPQTGAVQYVVVDYGGLLGLGSDEAVVPWERLRAMPGRNAFVLPVQRDALEQAPSPAGETLLDPLQTGSVNTEEVDNYWDQAIQE